MSQKYIKKRQKTQKNKGKKKKINLDFPYRASLGCLYQCLVTTTFNSAETYTPPAPKDIFILFHYTVCLHVLSEMSKSEVNKVVVIPRTTNKHTN